MTVPADPNTVQNAAAGAPLQAALLDAIRDYLLYLSTNKPHGRWYNNANFSVPNNTRTAVTFNSERQDVGPMHSTSSNTSRGTVPTADDGFFLAGAHCSWASNVTGQRNTELRLNGTTLIAIQSIPTVGSGAFEQSVVTGYQLAAADYLEMTLFQNSGGALNASLAGNYSPEMWMMWMSA